MSTPKKNKPEPIVLVRGPKLLKRFLTLRSRNKSIERELKKIYKQLDLPAPERSTIGEYILKSRKGDNAAKYTIYHRDGFVVDPTYIGKVT